MTAAAKRRRSSKARRRDPRRDYGRKAQPAALGQYRYRFVLRRKKRKLPTVVLDPLVQSATWERSSAFKTAELTLARPLGKKDVGLLLSGDTIDCQVARAGAKKWRTLWRMTLKAPEVDVVAGSMSVTLAVSAAPLKESKVAWKYRKDKAHPRGWLAHRIARDAAKRFRVKTGRLAQGTHRIKRLVRKHSSAYGIVTEAYRRERQVTGRRFVIDMGTGKLEVLELRRSRYMLQLGPAILEASLTQSGVRFCSAVIVTSSVKKKGSKKKHRIRVKVVDRKRLKRYGYIVHEVNEPGLETRAEARRFGKQWLARHARQQKDVEFTHPLMPFLDRGDTIDLDLSEAGLRQTAFVKTVSASVDSSSDSMTVVVGFDDPVLAARERQAKKKRDRAADRRKRRKDGKDKTDAPKSKKKERRAAA